MDELRVYDWKKEVEPNLPYLIVSTLESKWNPDFPQEALCECGHPYYRHFDTYDDMDPCGCKYAWYCGCDLWRDDRVV